MPEGSPVVEHDAPSSRAVDRGLREATAEDIPRLKTVLAEAFYDDPIIGWLMPDACV